MKNYHLLTTEEINFLFKCINFRFGNGYSQNTGVGQLQAKLSILGEMAGELGHSSKEVDFDEHAVRRDK